MMASDSRDGFENANLSSSEEKLETLHFLDSTTGTTSAHRSTISSFDSHHPLSPGDSDPLLNSKRLAPENSSPSSYIEPPAYSDIVFSPFDDESPPEELNGLSFDSPSFSKSTSTNGEYLKITVSNPQKEAETTNTLVPGGTTYVTYLITTRTNLSEFNGSEFSVRRRFRDVVTLSDRLAEAYRGFFIPPRPDKNVVESQMMQKQEFVEQRRVALEKYLRRLAAHPVIMKSDELQAFLRAQGKLPLPATTDVASRVLDGAVRLPKQLFGESQIMEVGQAAKGGRDLLRMFKELKQSVANDWGGTKPAVVEEDREFMEKKEKINELEQHLSSASQQAEALVKSQQDMGETVGELGLAFIKLTKFENEEALFNSQRLRAAHMKNIATAAVKASRFYRELNSHTVKHLDTLHEYLGTILSVHSAFSERSSALLTVQTLASDLSALHSKAEKLEATSLKVFGGDKSRMRKSEELKETINSTEAAKNIAVREYQRIKDNNKTELERFETAKQVDFLNMLKGLVLNQVGYAEKIASVWTKVAEETSAYSKDSN